jgi:hypothetical protein
MMNSKLELLGSWFSAMARAAAAVELQLAMVCAYEGNIDIFDELEVLYTR